MLSACAQACSVVSCVDNGIELHQNFRVRVTHDDRPLAGVSVQIRPTSPKMAAAAESTLTTTVDGLVGGWPGQIFTKDKILGAPLSRPVLWAVRVGSDEAHTRDLLCWVYPPPNTPYPLSTNHRPLVLSPFGTHSKINVSLIAARQAPRNCYPESRWWTKEISPRPPFAFADPVPPLFDNLPPDCPYSRVPRCLNRLLTPDTGY